MKKILFTCVMFLLMTMTTFAQTNTDIAALKAKAQAGNTDAMWQLGIHYFKSDGGELSKNVWLWLNQAYSKDSNNAMGLYYLGLWYGVPSTIIQDTENQEHYIPRDEKKVYNLIKRSANLGCIEAMVVYLRALYMSNTNPRVIVPVSKNERNKFKQIILAAAQKTEADFMLLAETAQYVPELIKESSVYVIKAIETNPDKALTLLTEKIYRYADSLFLPASLMMKRLSKLRVLLLKYSTILHAGCGSVVMSLMVSDSLKNPPIVVSPQLRIKWDTFI